jgi:hypothetical protein
VTAAIVAVAMVVLFGAGFLASRWLGNRGSTPDATPSASPCATTTVVPGAGLPKPSAVTANVYNATTIAGLARKTAAALKLRGFVIGKVANDPLGQDVAVAAELRHGPKGLAAAKLLAVYIAGSKLVDDGRTTADVDVSLGNAFKALRSPAAVTSILTKPVPVYSPPGCHTASAAPGASGSAAPKASASPSAS